MKRTLACTLIAVAVCALTSCQTPPLDSSTTTLYGFDPKDADVVVLCKVHNETNGIAHTIKEVWKGQELLPDRLRSRPNGQILLMSASEPKTTVSRRALVCFKNRPDSDNILTNNLGRETLYIYGGKIATPWKKPDGGEISIRTLRSEIKK